MLVLGRKNQEKILIGDDIEILVVSISQNSVRLGITAPKSLNIVRPEILTRTKTTEQKKAE